MFRFNFPDPSVTNNGIADKKKSQITQPDKTINITEAGDGDMYTETDDLPQNSVDPTEPSDVTETGQTLEQDTYAQQTAEAEIPDELPALEVSLDYMVENVKGWKKHIHTCKDFVPVHYYDCNEVEKKLSGKGDNPVAIAAEQNSDILPGIYEGGLKVWDCAIDLMDHISKQNLSLRDLNVLEIGCGAGLPGLYALTHQAHVTFQDYNYEVITHCTMPNCYANISKEKVPTNCSFYCGGWRSFLALMVESGKKFDIVLSSETIYQPNNYGILHDLFDQLTTEAATVYLAAKLCYFGLSGGSREFADFVKEKDVFSVENTLQRRRGVFTEVLCLKRKNCLEHITLPPE